MVYKKIIIYHLFGPKVTYINYQINNNITMRKVGKQD